MSAVPKVQSLVPKLIVRLFRQPLRILNRLLQMYLRTGQFQNDRSDLLNIHIFCSLKLHDEESFNFRGV